MTIAWNFNYQDEVTSTQDIVHEKLSENIKEGFVASASVQTKGRGRFGNTWVSEKGNLYTSFLLKPSEPKTQWGQYGFAVSLAVFDTVKELGVDAEHLQIKWPNDVLANGKKIAGILLESVSDHDLIIGIGLNIANPPEAGIGLQPLTPETLSATTVQRVLFNYMAINIKMLRQDGFAPVRARWLQYAAYLGHPIKVRLPDTTIEGIFGAIDESGALVLREPDGTERVITSGEIFGI